MDEPIGERFQNLTKYIRRQLPGGGPDFAHRPPPVKTYPGAARVVLPAPETTGGPPLWDAIRRRRSIRRYPGAPLTAAELSQLLWATQGLTHSPRAGHLRAAPSAGGLHPIETYLSIQEVEGIAAGIYHYAVGDHTLETLETGDMRKRVSAAGLDQDLLLDAHCVFIWTAVFQRCGWKYRQRAYRYIYLDAGHLAQNLALACAGMGLASCQVAALYDDEVNALVGVDGHEEGAVYMTGVGRP